MKKLISVMLTVCLVFTSTASSLSVYGTTTSSAGGELVLDEMTRAEWLHNLAVTFEMEVENEAYPDNYFSDLSSSHTYYYDVLLAVQFGVIDIECGAPVYPEMAVTREFATSTLNYCLGFQLEDEAEYTFSDVEACNYPDDAQVALNRQWVQLIDGAFSPETALTVEEADFMLSDAVTVWQSTVVDETAESTCVFQDDVVVFDEFTVVTTIDDDTLSIPDVTVELEPGDKFAVYINGIPNVYLAETVSVGEDALLVDYSYIDGEEGFQELETEGIVDSSEIVVEEVEGVETIVEEDVDFSASVRSRAVKKLKTIKVKHSLSVAQSTGTVELELKQPELHYQVSLTGPTYVYLEGDTSLYCNLSVNSTSLTTALNQIPLLNLTAPGIGGFKITLDGALEGGANTSINGALTVGISVSAADGMRMIKTFSCKSFSLNLEASGHIGVIAKLGITEMPIVKGYAFVTFGGKGEVKQQQYTDDLPPKCCSQFSAYLHAEAGLSASAQLGIWNSSKNIEYVIMNEQNSPVKLVYHYEDGKKVATCSRDNMGGSGTTTFNLNYHTPTNSIYSGGDLTLGESAEGFDAEGNPVTLYDYTVKDDGTASITKYYGSAISMMIPSTIDGYLVTEIGPEAFKDNKSLMRVTIPDTIETIGVGAFIYCTNLVEVFIPEGVKTIKEYAFEECTSLQAIEIPESMTELPLGFCLDCVNLKSVTIPDTVTVIGAKAFQNTAVTEVDLPDELTTLGEFAFGDCLGLTSMHIPKSMTTAHIQSWGPFYGCTNLKTFTFDDGIEKIADVLLADCPGLETFVIPDTVTEIGIAAFQHCENLQSITIPEGVTKIDLRAFEGCSSLTTVNIPEAVDEIGDRCFYHCTALQEIQLPTEMTYLGGRVFEGCTALQSLTVPKGLDLGWLPNYLCYGCTALEEVYVPRDINCINPFAFGECTALRYAYLTAEVTSIDDSTFTNCGNLTLCAERDSYTQTFAEENNIPFMATDNWTASLEQTKFTYSGAYHYPEVIVKNTDGETLTEGVDYELSGTTRRKTVGRSSLTVTFIGKYSGQKKLYYTVVPKAPSSVDANLRTVTGGYDDITVKWSKPAGGASGYAVYMKKGSGSYVRKTYTTSTSYTIKNLTDGAKYTFKIVPYYKSSSGTKYMSTKYKTDAVYTLKKVSLRSVAKSGTKVKVRWYNISGESGYQISRSTKRTGTNIVSTYKTTSGTYRLVSATKGKYYYYKVRAYKTVDGKKVYGPWSDYKRYKR